MSSVVLKVMSNCNGSGVLEGLLKWLHTVVKFFKINEIDYLGSDSQSFSWMGLGFVLLFFSFTGPGNISLSLMLTQNHIELFISPVSVNYNNSCNHSRSP